MASQPNTADIEIWKPVSGWESLYAVSSHGRIKRLAREVMVLTRWGRLSPRKLPEKVMCRNLFLGRYWQVTFKDNGRRETAYVHRVVCTAFHGAPPSPELEVAHGDGNGLNNWAENLRWASTSENNLDKVEHGTHNRGEAHPASKITERAVRELRSVGSNARDAEFAERFGMKLMTIRLIRCGHAWKWIN